MKDEPQPVPYKPLVGESCFILQDPITELYRSRAPESSKFAWVRVKGAAARFQAKEIAQVAAEGYSEGKDVIKELSMPSPHPEDVLYKDKLFQAKPPMKSYGLFPK